MLLIRPKHFNPVRFKLWGTICRNCFSVFLIIRVLDGFITNLPSSFTRFWSSQKTSVRMPTFSATLAISRVITRSLGNEGESHYVETGDIKNDRVVKDSPFPK